MKVFITGGGGFLGTYIVQKLVKRGYSVTNFSRSRYPHLENIGVHCVQGDLNNVDELVAAMKGHEVCFHVASKVAMWGKKEDFLRTNYKGTQNVIHACKKNSINKLIYTSTPSVVFGEHGFEGESEELPYPKKSYSRYGMSKAMAEKLVLESANDDFFTVALRPHLVFGPGDQNLIPRLVESARKKKLKMIGNGENKVDVLYVENAADAHICALDKMLTHPKLISGQAFFLGQGPVKLWEFINKILIHYGIDPIDKSNKLSTRLAFTIGKCFEALSSLFGLYNWNPPMTRFVALQLGEHHYYDHSKAEKLLEWKPKVDLDEALGRLN